jgi:Leucine-rich repeat (LRR) protein
MASRKPWSHVQDTLPEPPKTVDLTKVLAQARSSGVLNVSNRGLGPLLPEQISRLHENTQQDERVWENVDLRSFDISLNAIEELPPDIGDPDVGFPFLTKLIVRNNLLRTLPQSIGQLSLLAVLDVSHNQLEALPTSIGQLQALVELKCENNRLTFIPHELCFLPRLASLNLDDNALQTLPDSIESMQSLGIFTCNDHYVFTLHRVPSTRI